MNAGLVPESPEHRFPYFSSERRKENLILWPIFFPWTRPYFFEFPLSGGIVLSSVKRLMCSVLAWSCFAVTSERLFSMRDGKPVRENEDKQKEREAMVRTIIKRIRPELGLRRLCRSVVRRLAASIRPMARYLFRMSRVIANPRLASQLGQASMTMLPLVAVVGLCILMVGLRGKSQAQETQAHPSEAQSELSDKALAEFQRQHIVHATIRVPQ